MQDFFPRLEPDQFGFGLAIPESFGALDGFPVKLAVLGQRADMGVRGKRLRRREDALLAGDAGGPGRSAFAKGMEGGAEGRSVRHGVLRFHELI